MGQKVNPHGLRVGVIKDWDSKWYEDAEYSDFDEPLYSEETYMLKRIGRIKDWSSCRTIAK